MLCCRPHRTHCTQPPHLPLALSHTLREVGYHPHPLDPTSHSSPSTFHASKLDTLTSTCPARPPLLLHNHTLVVRETECIMTAAIPATHSTINMGGSRGVQYTPPGTGAGPPPAMWLDCGRRSLVLRGPSALDTPAHPRTQLDVSFTPIPLLSPFASVMCTAEVAHGRWRMRSTRTAPPLQPD